MKEVYQAWDLTNNRAVSKLHDKIGPARGAITSCRNDDAWYDRRANLQNLPSRRPTKYVVRVYEVKHIYDEDYERR
jgi:hypothetical protein